MATASDPSQPAHPRRGALAWALYEAGRTPYFVLVNIYVFAPYFTGVVVGDPVRGQTIWGLVTAAAAVLTALLAPVLGAAADAGGRRKPWLLAMTAVAVPAMMLLWTARPGATLLWPIVALIAAGSAFELSVVFHNALLTQVAAPERIGRLSGLSFAGGNLATLAVLAVFTFFLSPRLDAAAHAPERSAGLLAAAWFALLSVPLFVWTPDAPPSGRPLGAAVRDGLGRLRRTLGELPRHREIARYLLARMIFNDGFLVILYFAGVYAGGLFSWRAETLTVFGVLSTLAAVAGGVLGGWLDDRFGSRRTLLGAVAVGFFCMIVTLTTGPGRILGVEVAVAAGAPPLSTAPELVFLANAAVCTVAILAGIASSRSFVARLAPPGMTAEFFGLFALSGNAVAFLGPLSVSLATAASGGQRGGFAVVLVFLGAGGALLLRVRDDGRAPALQPAS